MLFDVINDKWPNWIDITFFHQHEEELDCLNQTLFAGFLLDVSQVYTNDNLLVVLL